MQENIPHMTPPPAGTADTWQDGFMLFTYFFCLAICMLQQKPGFVRPGGVLSLLSRPLLPITTHCSVIQIDICLLGLTVCIASFEVTWLPNLNKTAT